MGNERSLNSYSSSMVVKDLVNDLEKSVLEEFCFLIEGDIVRDMAQRTVRFGALMIQKILEQY